MGEFHLTALNPISVFDRIVDGEKNQDLFDGDSELDEQTVTLAAAVGTFGKLFERKEFKYLCEKLSIITLTPLDAYKQINMLGYINSPQYRQYTRNENSECFINRVIVNGNITEVLWHFEHDLRSALLEPNHYQSLLILAHESLREKIEGLWDKYFL